MKRRKFVALVICMFCVNEIVINYCCCDVVSSFSPPSSQVSNFQNAIQQQVNIIVLISFFGIAYFYEIMISTALGVVSCKLCKI